MNTKIKHNTALLGYDSISDFIQTNLGLSHLKLNCFASIIAILTTFITDYVYDDARAYYFLIFSLAVDFITGIWKSVKNKTFSSSRIPRMFVTILFYSLMLSLAWNSARSSELFIWLPSAIFAGFLSTTLVSIFENIYAIGFLPKSIYDILKQRLRIQKYFQKDVDEK